MEASLFTQTIEVSNNDYHAKLAELRKDKAHIEGVKVISGGYRLTVQMAENDCR